MLQVLTLNQLSIIRHVTTSLDLSLREIKRLDQTAYEINLLLLCQGGQDVGHGP